MIKPWRYRGATRGLRDYIVRGDIGDVRMISLWWLYPRVPFIGKEWFRDPKEGGFFLDAGSHCFDYLRWVAGAEPVRKLLRGEPMMVQRRAEVLLRGEQFVQRGLLAG